MIQVVPAIIPESYDHLREQVGRVHDITSRVQIDIADGKFAPSVTWPYASEDRFDALAHQEEGLPFWEDINFELDMMIESPEKEIDNWIATGITAAVIHVESTDKLEEAIEKARKKDVSVTLALSPSTPNEHVTSWLKRADKNGEPWVSGVQFMGNDKLGYHGVPLDEKVIDKIKDLRAVNKHVTIAIDIGVNEETAPKLVEAGVDVLVSGSALFGSDNIAHAIRKFQTLG